MESSRKPSIGYEGRNGFTENPWPDPQTESSAAEKYRAAQYILTQKGRPVPSLKEMKEELAKPEDLAGRIKALQKQHLSDLERMYDFHAQDYHDEAVDRRRSRDETQFLDKMETNAAIIAGYKRLEGLYQSTRQRHATLNDWDNDIDRLRYNYLSQLLPLLKRQRDEQRIRDARFPQSIQEFRMIPNKDIQLRVVRFLTVKEKQDAMLGEFGWSWKEVQVLLDELQRNASFRAEISEKAKELEVKDPRKKR